MRRELGLVQLLDPPFDDTPLDPGYIRGYIPGVRENGGQYTHAAVWTAMAFAAAGDRDRAWHLLTLVSPIHRSQSPEAVDVYKVEPYAVSADIYSNPQHVGRGGWTWYTGGAGWMYRFITESLLGIHLEVDHLRLEPLLPVAWTSFRIHYRYRNTVHHINVRNNAGGVVTKVVCDGVEQSNQTIPLLDDGEEHHITVELG